MERCQGEAPCLPAWGHCPYSDPAQPRLPTFFSLPLSPACGAPRPISLATSRNVRAGGGAVVLLPSLMRVSGTLHPRATCEFCPMPLSSWAAHVTAALCMAPGGSCGQHYQTHLASFRETFQLLTLLLLICCQDLKIFLLSPSGEHLFLSLSTLQIPEHR